MKEYSALEYDPSQMTYYWNLSVHFDFEKVVLYFKSGFGLDDYHRRNLPS